MAHASKYNVLHFQHGIRMKRLRRFRYSLGCASSRARRRSYALSTYHGLSHVSQSLTKLTYRTALAGVSLARCYTHDRRHDQVSEERGCARTTLGGGNLELQEVELEFDVVRGM